MISKNDIKFINSLHRKKGRDAESQYLIEGVKLVGEAIASGAELLMLYATDESLIEHSRLQGIETEVISKKAMERITGLNSASPLLAIAKKVKPDFEMRKFEKERFVMLDGIRDPGNLGTIIRTCEWFGIKQIIASNDTVDLYNGKVIQSTMGSMFRVDVCYLDLREFLQGLAPWKLNIPVYGAVLNGDPLAENMKNTDENGCLVIGSESHGISEPVLSLCSHKLTIKGIGNTESLNAAISASILMYEWTR